MADLSGSISAAEAKQNKGKWVLFTWTSTAQNARTFDSVADAKADFESRFSSNTGVTAYLFRLPEVMYSIDKVTKNVVEVS